MPILADLDPSSRKHRTLPLKPCDLATAVVEETYQDELADGFWRFLLAEGWFGAQNLKQPGVSKFAFKQGAKELPGVLLGHGSVVVL